MPLSNNSIDDTNALIQVVPNLLTAQSFLLDKFFPGIVTSDTEFVSIDVDIGKRRMAPFVSPLVEGKLVESRRFQTNSFKPAYIKDKRAPDLRKPVRRMMGERIGGGDMTPGQREDANIQFEMEDQVDMVTRRLEWMAAKVLTTGMVTIAGDGYPTTLVDFARDSALTIALSGSAMWDSGNAAASPQMNIEYWQQLILKKSGANATDIVFTVTAWNYFLRDPVIKAAIWFPGSGAGNTLNLGPKTEKGATFKGVWGGYNLWVYNDWYVDETTGVETPMIPDGTVILCGPQMQGTRAFATIYDPKFNYASLPYAPKTWISEDPAQRYLMMQSSPIIIPSRVNACLAATVTNAIGV